MSFTFAFECYADEDVVLFLRDHCGLAIKTKHSFGQGEVVNDVLKKGVAGVGMVDEDPGSSHHPLRDEMRVIWRTDDLELRERAGRHLVVLKPELEHCFLAGLRRTGLQSELPSSPKDLQRSLNIPRHPAHRLFRQELAGLYQAAKSRNVSTFITDLENALVKIASR